MLHFTSFVVAGSFSWDALQVAQDHPQSARQWEEDAQGKGGGRDSADDAREGVG